MLRWRGMRWRGMRCLEQLDAQRMRWRACCCLAGSGCTSSQPLRPRGGPPAPPTPPAPPAPPLT
eukprot:scaffold129099_cov45-Phaeocystis_antarctica.AAC.1